MVGPRAKRYIKPLARAAFGAVGLEVRRQGAAVNVANHISDLTATIDFLFSQHYGSYIGQEVLPRANEAVSRNIALHNPNEPHLIKRYAPKGNGPFSPFQRFILELDCLSRLSSIKAPAQHFPALLGFSVEEMTITVTNQGLSLDSIMAPVNVPGHEKQTDQIFEYLKRASIVLYDMHATGKNLCIDSAGNLSVIDFDIAMVSTHPFSDVFVQKNFSLATKDGILGIIRNHSLLRLSS